MSNLGGSEVYRIAPDGSPKTMWSSHEDLVYALAFDQAGHLLAGTGNRGKIYVIGSNDYTDLAKASANQVTAFARAPKDGLYAATSNLGKVFLLGPSPVAEGTYESDVFDAKNFSQWGRVEVRGKGNYRSVRAQRQRRQSRPELEPVEAGRSAEKPSGGCAVGALHSVEGSAASG